MNSISPRRSLLLAALVLAIGGGAGAAVVNSGGESSGQVPPGSEADIPHVPSSNQWAGPDVPSHGQTGAGHAADR